MWSNSIDFNPGGGIDSKTAVGGTDIYVNKLNSSGVYQGVTVIGGTGNDGALDVAIDSSNNVFLAGYFSGTVDFDPSASTANRVSNGATDIFLARYSNVGAYSWSNTWGGTSSDFGYSVDDDGSGNLFVTGYFIGSVDFDPGAGTQYYSSNGITDAFLSKFSTSGNFDWARTWGGSGDDHGHFVAVNNNGYPYVVGFFENTVNFAPVTQCGGSSLFVTSAGSRDIYLMRYQPDGCW